LVFFLFSVWIYCYFT